MAKELNIRQEKFLKALLEVASINEACNQAGINRTTGYKYLKDSFFMSEYRKIRREAMQQVTARLQKESEKAVDVLSSVMLDTENNPNSRVQAAKNILDIAYRSIELDDTGERIERLEASLNED